MTTQRFEFGMLRERMGVTCSHLAHDQRVGRSEYTQSPSESSLVHPRWRIHLVVAHCGDVRPGYLCIDRALPEGGDEESVSYAGPGGEAPFKEII